MAAEHSPSSVLDQRSQKAVSHITLVFVATNATSRHNRPTPRLALVSPGSSAATPSSTSVVLQECFGEQLTSAAVRISCNTPGPLRPRPER
jgi:hypothetical protein